MLSDSCPRMAGGGSVPPPQPVPPLPGPDVAGIELPPEPTQPAGVAVGPHNQEPPPEQPVPVREPPGTPPPEHAR